MRAARLNAFGLPLQVVEVVDLPEPVPAEGEALVEVLAAPINPADVGTLSGTYGMLPTLPAVPGLEGVGRVLEVRGDAQLAPGTLVLLPMGVGTWRERLVARASLLTPLPAGADALQLAMLSVNPPTAELLLRAVPLSPGEWVVQNGANSAVGRYVITLARQKGLRTLNVVRRAELVAELQELGADVVLVDGEDLAQRARAAMGGEGARVAFDCVGGSATARLGDALCEGGRLYVYGAMSGRAPVVSAAALIFRDVRVEGFWLARWLKEAPREEREALYASLAEQVARGTLRAPVDATFPLERLHEALARALQGGRAGKVLLVPR